MDGARYSSTSAGDLSSIATTANRPPKIIQLQHPTAAASTSAAAAPSSYLSKWRAKVKRMSQTDWIELFLPCYRWISRYKWREYLQPDLMSGVTVGVMLVPQSMSYAKLAGLHPIYGLYSGFVPIFVYAIFGSSRQLAIGPVALTSLLVSNVLGSIVSPSERLYTELAILLALMVGIFECIMGLLRLGWILRFISHSVISGFTTASAIIIALSQAKDFLGYSVVRSSEIIPLIKSIIAGADQGVDDSIHIFTGHTGELYTAVCSPTDATLVATGGGDDKRFLWRIGQGDWAFEVQGHQDSVSSLSFSINGQLLASGSLDGIVKVWDMANRDVKCTLEGPSGGIEWVRWHPRGHLVLAGSEDSSIWMWNADNAVCLNVFSGHGGSVTCGDFTPDGRTICSGSDDATMRIWNPRTAEVIHVVRGHPYHTEGITCLTISSDSALALTGSSDGSVHVVNISTGRVVSSLNAHSDSVECAAFEASSRRDSWRVATGGMDKKLIIWDQNSSPRCICNHEEEVTCLIWLAGSRYIATGCLDGKVRIWDSLSGDCAKVLSGHSDAIQSISASSTGEYLVSVSLDGTARVFEIAEFLGK